VISFPTRTESVWGTEKRLRSRVESVPSVRPIFSAPDFVRAPSRDSKRAPLGFVRTGVWLPLCVDLVLLFVATYGAPAPRSHFYRFDFSATGEWCRLVCCASLIWPTQNLFRKRISPVCFSRPSLLARDFPPRRGCAQVLPRARTACPSSSFLRLC
jgi:hypothetical protein